MYSRLLRPPETQSFFLFGPRGVGKTAWLRRQHPQALFFDLLDSEVYTQFLAAPHRLADQVPTGYSRWIVLDEVQRVPELLNEVHRLIEGRKLRFILSGSSARKLRRKGVNLLAGRALTRHMHPLTASELGSDFDLSRVLRFGCLPFACTTARPRDYLKSYVATYLREEVQQEGLVRNLGAFGRFLEAVSFSQGQLLSMAGIGRDCSVSPKVVEDYLSILEDLLIATRVPVFAKRAKRRLVAHPKFYLFDTGVFQAIRPRGPLDSPEEIEGPALETLFLQQVSAVNDYLELGYDINYWRTAAGEEVDFVLYGERGLYAFEIKRSQTVRDEDFKGIRLFKEDFPQAKTFLLHLGKRHWHDRGIEVMPFQDSVVRLAELIR